MPLETASYVTNLVETNPDGGDQASTLDQHDRLIKAVLKRTFPVADGPISISGQVVAYVGDLSASAQAQLNALRDGSATANNAIYANSASYAASAGSAANLAGVAASDYARQSQQNTFTANQFIVNNTPILSIRDTGVADPDAQIWAWVSGGSTFLGTAYNAGFAGGSNWLSVLRSGSTISSITLAGTTINLTGTVNATVSNALTANSASYAVLAGTAAAAAFATTCTSASSAQTLAGLSGSTVGNANTVALRDASGHIYCENVNQSSPINDVSVGHIACMTNLDGFWRKNTVANVGTYLEARNITGRTGIAKTLSSSTPSGGSNGDIWYRY